MTSAQRRRVLRGLRLWREHDDLDPAWRGVVGGRLEGSGHVAAEPDGGDLAALEPA